jgi:predicted membrane-bound spermidine synthase
MDQHSEVDCLTGHYILAFLMGAFTMSIEIVAGRIIAPALGVSLYTWTSVIGAVLLGSSAGSFAGGMLADRYDPRRLLGRAILLAGVVTLLILPSTPLIWWVGPFGEQPLARVVFPTLVLFGVPGFFIGLVAPVIYRICVTDPERTGSTVGRLAASGSLGSIAGTFATGFWLIGWVGTRTVVLGIGCSLLVLGVLFSTWKSPRMKATALVAVVLTIALGFGTAAAFFHSIFTESAYYAIFVLEEEDPEGGTLKKLLLDSLVHSGANPARPDFLWYEYERIAAWIIENRMPKDARTLFIGGGGYTLPYWVERHYPDATIDVVEIDPEVTKVALKEFIYDSRRIVSINEDGRTALRNMEPERKYDLIFSDAFNDVSVPYHLTTLEFDQNVKARLTSRGFYMVNIVDRGDGGFLSAFSHTLSRVFAHVYVLPGSVFAAVDDTGRTPWIIVASDEPVPFATWEPPRDVFFSTAPRGPDPKGILLTDDYAPVDNLLLPVINDKLRR